MHILKILLLFFTTILFSESIDNSNTLNIDSSNTSENISHINLLLNESMINEFLHGILPIKDKGEALLLTYNWELMNPRLDIEKDTALFFSDIKLSVGPVETTKKIQGWVSVKFDKTINKIILKIEEAKVALDINILGKNILLKELNIAEYFSTPFKLNGPEPISSKIEYKLPNGEIRRVSCRTVKSELKSVKDAIEVLTTLEFDKIDE